MTKVKGPLFGTAATGRIAGFGSFRMGRHGPEFIEAEDKPRKAQKRKPKLRDCFKQAKAAHARLTPFWEKVDDRWQYHRYPDWPTFWRTWLINNPGCKR